MDFLIYLGILFVIGMYRVNATKNIPDDVSISMSQQQVVEMSDLPVAENLQLVRDPNAFMYIVRQLGLG